MNKIDIYSLYYFILIGGAIGASVYYGMTNLAIVPMNTKKLTITQMTFTEGTATNGTIVVDVTNSGTGDITVALVKVNGVTLEKDGTTGDSWAIDAEPIPAGDSAILTIITTIESGNK